MRSRDAGALAPGAPLAPSVLTALRSLRVPFLATSLLKLHHCLLILAPAPCFGRVWVGAVCPGELKVGLLTPAGEADGEPLGHPEEGTFLQCGTWPKVQLSPPRRLPPSRGDKARVVFQTSLLLTVRHCSWLWSRAGLVAAIQTQDPRDDPKQAGNQCEERGLWAVRGLGVISFTSVTVASSLSLCGACATIAPVPSSQGRLIV